MKHWIPKHIFIDQSATNHPQTKLILSRLPGVETTLVQNADDCYQKITANHQESEKELLYLTLHQGKFLKPCPCTPHHICCGYRFIDLTAGCNFDCTYCIMQSYLDFPAMRVHVNMEDFFPELDEWLIANPDKKLRMGTGEMTDSLSLDHITGQTKFLVEETKKRENCVLELKTKSTAVNHLLDLDHQRKIIIAWSLNTPKMIKTEEKGATALIARLRAAQKCDEKNFWLAFHFDPLLLYPGCEAEYLATIDAIFTHVRPQNIAWISFGALRFMPELKTVIQEQHPESEIVYGEFARGEDGKCRYFKPLRQKLFSKLYHKIKNHSKEVPLYFCMERPDIYEKITGNAETSESVQAMLDQRVFGNK